jgi:2-oxoglutarate dehydrogenase E1 component
MSGIVLLLPHGYEGQGPEHSSARLERFLQLCAENNMQVCNLTTPAQYFHALRRQMHRNFRKPLILMTPKSLLRHKLAVSFVSEFTEGRFHPVLGDPEQASPERVRRVLLCSGKVYYDLLLARGERKADDVAIVRVEQLYPFPAREIREALAPYPASAELYWVQEEPQNMGSWFFMEQRLARALDRRAVHYAGRDEAASPATGSYKVHQSEQTELINRAFAKPHGH